MVIDAIDIFLFITAYLLVGLGMVHALVHVHSRYDLATTLVYAIGAALWPFILVIAAIMTFRNIIRRM